MLSNSLPLLVYEPSYIRTAVHVIYNFCMQLVDAAFVSHSYSAIQQL